MTFHDDSIKFMTDLLKLLEKESQTAPSGEYLIGIETAQSVLLRLIGITKLPVLSKVTQTEAKVTSSDAPNLVDDFFKIKTTRTDHQLAEINSLLRAYRGRLSRYSKARTEIKLKRTKKLIETPSKPLKANDLVKDNPTQTRRFLAEKQRELRKTADLKGILDQDIQLQKALEVSVNRASELPDNLGPFSTQLQRFMSATAKEALDKIEQLDTLKQEIRNEVYKLENADNLLFKGVPTFNRDSKKLSLLQVIDVLIFLTDRKKMKFDCSQCKYYLKGKSEACTFAGSGSVSPTPLVTLTDAQGTPIIGRLTRSTNSCKEVWGLETNEYFTASDDIIVALKKLLEN